MSSKTITVCDVCCYELGPKAPGCGTMAITAVVNSLEIHGYLSNFTYRVPGKTYHKCLDICDHCIKMVIRGYIRERDMGDA